MVTLLIAELLWMLLLTTETMAVTTFSSRQASYIHPPPPPPPPPHWFARRQRMAAAIDVNAEVIEQDDNNNMEVEEREWIPDSQKRKSEHYRSGDSSTNTSTRSTSPDVINYDPEQPSSRPLRSAAAVAAANNSAAGGFGASPTYMHEDTNTFRNGGVRKNNSGQRSRPIITARDGDSWERDGGRMGGGGGLGATADPREQHILIDDEYYDGWNDDYFFRPMPPPMQGMPPGRMMPPAPGRMQGMQGMAPPLPPRRPPPLMEEMMVLQDEQQQQRPTTQQFAGLGTMTKKPGSAISKNRNGMTPLSYQNRPPPPPPPPQTFPQSPFPPPPPSMLREEGYLGDSTLTEISLDYSIPIPYLADVLTSWGVPVPIDPHDRLGDLITAQQAYAVLEAIYTLDVASLHDRYSQETILSLCDIYDMDVKVVFEYCVERGWGLPFGVRTFLRVEQEEELLDVLS